MEKEIVLMAKSRKYHNYCVAGIDLKTAKWIRVISKNKEIHNAVKPEDLKYGTDKEAQILHRVIIPIKFHAPNFFQPENYVLDNQYYLQYNGILDKKKLIQFVENKQYIFYNEDKKIHTDELKLIPINKRYSLILIRPERVTIHVKTWKDGSRTISCSFFYNRNWYKYLKITDNNFEMKYLRKNDGDYYINNEVLFVISLGEIYYRDDCHYKLIASVIEL